MLDAIDTARKPSARTMNVRIDHQDGVGGVVALLETGDDRIDFGLAQPGPFFEQHRALGNCVADQERALPPATFATVNRNVSAPAA